MTVEHPARPPKPRLPPWNGEVFSCRGGLDIPGSSSGQTIDIYFELSMDFRGWRLGQKYVAKINGREGPERIGEDSMAIDIWEKEAMDIDWHQSRKAQEKIDQAVLAKKEIEQLRAASPEDNSKQIKKLEVKISRYKKSYELAISKTLTNDWLQFEEAVEQLLAEEDRERERRNQAKLKRR